MTDLAFGESPRWHDDRLWVSDWGEREIIAVDLDGKSEVMVKLDFPSFQAICFDWLPDGRLLVVSGRDRLLLRREADGSFVTHADLRGLSEIGHPWNAIVIDGTGTSPTNVLCAFAKVVRCCRLSTLTADVLLACSGASTAKRCSW